MKQAFTTEAQRHREQPDREGAKGNRRDQSRHFFFPSFAHSSSSSSPTVSRYWCTSSGVEAALIWRIKA